MLTVFDCTEEMRSEYKNLAGKPEGRDKGK
jgi:hypothetical protein